MVHLLQWVPVTVPALYQRINLDNCKYLTMDEADRLVDMGFEDEVRCDYALSIPPSCMQTRFGVGAHVNQIGSDCITQAPPPPLLHPFPLQSAHSDCSSSQMTGKLFFLGGPNQANDSRMNAKGFFCSLGASHCNHMQGVPLRPGASAQQV